MKLIVGLGNPGDTYKQNRHNVGFIFADYIENEFRILNHEILHEQKFDSVVHVVRNEDEKVLLIKPQLFMNKSGIAVRKIRDFYHIGLHDIYIVHDDLDLPLGQFKLQKGRGPKIHNGLLSIEQQLGSKDFNRIRIGIDNRTPINRINGEAYVLSDFRPEEKEILEDVFDNILKNIHFFSHK